MRLLMTLAALSITALAADNSLAPGSETLQKPSPIHQPRIQSKACPWSGKQMDQMEQR